MGFSKILKFVLSIPAPKKKKQPEKFLKLSRVQSNLIKNI